MESGVVSATPVTYESGSEKDARHGIFAQQTCTAELLTARYNGTFPT